MKKIVFIFVQLAILCLILIYCKKILSPSYPGMIYIPQGEFTIGSDKGYPYEGPKQKVILKAFFIDKTEVTNRQYKRFIDNTNYSAPPHWKNNTYPEGEDDYPVVNVSFEDAQAYANWVGKRLPTEFEWEKAARGTDERVFPWGNIWEKNASNIAWLLRLGKIKKVASHNVDISIYGCYDMAGNVREWTSSKFEPYPGYIGDKKYFSNELFVVKGGSYNLPKNFCFTYRRDALTRTTKLPNLGFRCVKDIK
ncbi:MAG: formylglycine-generating enzyme family protein [Endomicrobia bacterium]|nr:formylglycine-generating enzyme family protein [Endomicrobiia bacterium]